MIDQTRRIKESGKLLSDAAGKYGKVKLLSDNAKIKSSIKKAKNSVLEDRREISSSKMTMDDVYKARITSKVDRRSSAAVVVNNAKAFDSFLEESEHRPVAIRNDNNSISEENVTAEIANVRSTDGDLNDDEETYEYEDDFEVST